MESLGCRPDRRSPMEASSDGSFAGRKICQSFLSFALALLSAVACARAEEFSKTIRYATRMFSTGTLFVDTRTGDLHVEGWDDPRLEIEAEKVVRAGSQKKAARLYDVVSIALVGQD